MANSDLNEIRGRLVLITGAAGGIGSACAREFVKYSCNLALAYSSNVAAATQLAQELQDLLGSSGRVTTHQADLSIPDEVSRLCVEVQDAHARPIDILVSNAGYGRRIRDVSDITLSEFDKMININLRAPFMLVKGVVDCMKTQHWGRIIMVSSIAARGGGMNGAHYAASKGGLMGMMKNLSTTLAQHNISVNDVAPAMVGNTGMIPNGDSFPGLVESIPLQRLCEPAEVARAVLFYATCGFATGQSLIVAGGLK